MSDFDFSLVTYIQQTTDQINLDYVENLKNDKCSPEYLRGRLVSNLKLMGLELAAFIVNFVRIPFELIAKGFLSIAENFCKNAKAGSFAAKIVDLNGKVSPLQIIDNVASTLLGLFSTILFDWTNQPKNHAIHQSLGLATQPLVLVIDQSAAKDADAIAIDQSSLSASLKVDGSSAAQHTPSPPQRTQLGVHFQTPGQGGNSTPKSSASKKFPRTPDAFISGLNGVFVSPIPALFYIPPFQSTLAPSPAPATPSQSLPVAAGAAPTTPAAPQGADVNSSTMVLTPNHSNIISLHPAAEPATPSRAVQVASSQADSSDMVSTPTHGSIVAIHPIDESNAWNQQHLRLAPQPVVKSRKRRSRSADDKPSSVYL